MEPGKIPTKEEVVKTLEKIYTGLPRIIEDAKQGIFSEVPEEGMVVLNNIPTDIVAVAVKEFTVLFNVV